MSSRASIVVAALLLVPASALAQYRPAPLIDAYAWSDSTAADSAAARPGSHRYPIIGSALGFVLPGLGHVYSVEYRRAGIVFAVTMGGAYFALNDASPHAAAAVGSVFFAGGWLFSTVDGWFAASRYNRRHSGAVVSNH